MNGDENLLEKIGRSFTDPSKSAKEVLPESLGDGADTDPGAASSQALAPVADGDGALHATLWGAEITRRLINQGAARAAAQTLGERADAGCALSTWAARYLLTVVVGKARGTLEGKSRDLAEFIVWFVARPERRGRGDITAWTVADTQLFLRHLGTYKKPPTINRCLATLRHFAKYVHEQPGGHFARHGQPTARIPNRHVDEPETKKLTDEQVEALIAVAQCLALGATDEGQPNTDAVGPPHSRARPQRNLAVVAMLYLRGLRISEALALTRGQYDGEMLRDVVRKGGRISRKVHLSSRCRGFIDVYVEGERRNDVAFLDSSPDHPTLPDADRPLFLSAKSARAVDRKRIARVLAALTVRVLATPGYTGGHFHAHPHSLRHTFGARYRKASGSDTETAKALGHVGLANMGRYVGDTDEERKAMLEKVF